jgi:hypothetical protein
VAQVKHKGEAPLSEKIRIHVSPMQQAAITARAKDLNLTVADYLRSLAKADILQNTQLEWPEKAPFYEKAQ